MLLQPLPGRPLTCSSSCCSFLARFETSEPSQKMRTNHQINRKRHHNHLTPCSAETPQTDRNPNSPSPPKIFPARAGCRPTCSLWPAGAGGRWVPRARRHGARVSGAAHRSVGRLRHLRSARPAPAVRQRRNGVVPRARPRSSPRRGPREPPSRLPCPDTCTRGRAAAEGGGGEVGGRWVPQEPPRAGLLLPTPRGDAAGTRQTVGFGTALLRQLLR